jgi:lactoylglutathione lyase
MEFLHTMLRVKDLDRALAFWQAIGLKVLRHKDYEKGRFTLVFMATQEGAPEVELTYNWDQSEEYSFGRNFGHLAFRVDDIYATCSELEAKGITILRPPRDGHMAFIKSPDNQSVELLQRGEALPPQEPWISRENVGSW